LDEAIAKKLISFGASDLNIGQSEFALLRWELLDSNGDSVVNTFEALCNIKSKDSVFKNKEISQDILSMEDGAIVEYMAPPGAFSIASTKSTEHFRLTVEKCFKDAKWAASYLATAAREGLRSEEECMDLFTALQTDIHWEPVNDLWLGFQQRTIGDSIQVNKQVVIEYNTYLLSGERLDSLTTMEFEFGKVGQLLPGMQWGLAKMREGESALILCPSKWAFGEQGLPNGHIPPRTPIYWDVRIIEVRK